MNKKLLSIVVPIYNEEANIPILYKELSTVLAQLSDYNYEIVMINDGSIDNSWHLIKTLTLNDPQIKGISFTRNFGHQAALSAGYEIAKGDAIITMDADLQHPPAVILSLVHAWHKGAYIVYVKNSKRTDRLLKNILSSLYYKILNRVAEVPMPENVADFRLIDKKVLAIVHDTKEQSYLRGIIAWTGFPHTILSVEFPARRAGTSQYTWKKMFKLACDGLTHFSLFPLKIASYVGIFVIVTGTGMLSFITLEALIYHAHYPLFKWLVTIMYIFIGVLFILLWIIGEYIGRIYQELKGRPKFIIQEMHNLEQKKELDESHGVSINSFAKYISGVHKDRNPSH
jgi:polyisoprenyl-phosphate glycosyltransferase